MAQGMVRIIAGQWRGRRLKIPEVVGLRPTPDRVRETIFNWLTPYLANAVCLDAFAGSGVLGFEAVSRGATLAVLIDRNPTVVKALASECANFSPQQFQLYRAELPHGLRSHDKRFDIVFLDPPYQSNLLLPTCFHLEAQDFLAPNAYIYLESNVEITDSDLPSNWRIVKAKHAGQVFYHLAHRT